jgi:hypothetical protein
MEAATTEIDGVVKTLARSVAVKQYRAGWGRSASSAPISTERDHAARRAHRRDHELRSGAATLSSRRASPETPPQLRRTTTLNVVAVDRSLGTITMLGGRVHHHRYRRGDFDLLQRRPTGLRDPDASVHRGPRGLGSADRAELDGVLRRRPHLGQRPPRVAFATTPRPPAPRLRKCWWRWSRASGARDRCSPTSTVGSASTSRS